MFSIDLFLKLVFVMASLFCLVAVYLTIRAIKEEVPNEDRTYMDPLPSALRIIWPLVNLLSFYVGNHVSTEQLIKIGKSLQKSGIAYLMTPEQYVGMKAAATIIGVMFSLLMMWLLDSFDILWVFAGGFLGFMLPSLTLNDLKKKREKNLVRALPTYLDYLTMAVQAGLNVTGAMQQSVDKGPPGPLQVEFRKVLRDVKAGMARVDALKEMSDRNEIKEINAFVTAVVQAEKTGASVGQTLKIQSDQRRVERFQRAEKLAMEAPVKLIFPLVAFIFPMTFMVLFFPIVMKFMYDM